jgi:acetyl esterase/lipase
MDMNRRDCAALLAASLVVTGMAGVRSASAAAGAARVPFDPLPFVHPDLRAMATQLAKMGNMAITAETLPASRKGGAQFNRPPLAAPAWREEMVPGLDRQPAVKVAVINAGERAAPRPAILNIHGGGFIMGDFKSDLRQMQEIAAELDCAIVSVEYRLAPETRFPGPLDDNYAALKWLYANAEKLGVDKSRIAVMGGSAGGGHAAMLAIAARDRGEVPIAYQALIYPMLDDRTGSTVHKPPYQGALLWSPEANRFGWTSLLGVPAGSRHVPKGSVPAREENLAGLPPTFLGVGSIDLFVDEGVDYARRLADAGVLTELIVVPGAFHGFNLVETAPVVKRYKAHFMAALRQGLGLPA